MFLYILTERQEVLLVNRSYYVCSLRHRHDVTWRVGLFLAGNCFVAQSAFKLLKVLPHKVHINSKINLTVAYVKYIFPLGSLYKPHRQA